MTTISGDAKGTPSLPRATRLSTRTRSASCRLKPEVSSEVAPFCTTMALSVRPVDLKASRNPAETACSTTNTATTSAIPAMASRLVRHRTRRFRTL